MGRIFLTRHGQTVANRDRVIQGPRIDAELSDLGHRQAHSLGHALAGHRLSAVYSSPLVRARATAAAIARHHREHASGAPARPRLHEAHPIRGFDQVGPAGALATKDLVAGLPFAEVAHQVGAMSVQVAPEIYEIDYGAFIGQRYDEVAPEIDQVLDAWRLGFVDQPFPGGESAALAQHRIRPFVARIKAQAEQHDVAVVAHGRINRVMLATLTGQGLQALEEYPQANACITELVVEGGKATVVRLNDTSHLDAPSDAFG